MYVRVNNYIVSIENCAAAFSPYVLSKAIVYCFGFSLRERMKNQHRLTVVDSWLLCLARSGGDGPTSIGKGTYHLRDGDGGRGRDHDSSNVRTNLYMSHMAKKKKLTRTSPIPFAVVIFFSFLFFLSPLIFLM